VSGQLSNGFPLSLPKSAYEYGERSSGEMHGVVLTKRKDHIVNMILDISGYRDSEDLAVTTFLEPSVGHGAFLIPAINRFFTSLQGQPISVHGLKERFLAYDIDEEHVEITRRNVLQILRGNGVELSPAEMLAEYWVRCGDFLLECEYRTFDFIVGNPPYIRIEQLSPLVQAEYRSRFTSLFDRADIYVAFIEHGLDLLAKKGSLAFICADRWILNKYGAPLRRKITEGYGIRYYIDLHQASPFESDVIAYPAVFTIGRKKSKTVQVTKLNTASPAECGTVTKSLLSSKIDRKGLGVHEYKTWFNGSEPWVLGSPKHLEALRELESRFDSLENHGDTKVSIGVATGNDKVYIVENTLEVEPDRLVPLVKREGIIDGQIHDSNRAVINTFENGKGTIDLDAYPKLRTFFQENEALVKKRHVAKKNPNSWFRTIDRVYPELVKKPKLLIPDIAGSNEVAYDKGKYHPHHNLYYITSSEWDLEVLGGLLSSRVALFFIWSCAVKMRGKYLRFQAQYLRRICIPKTDSLSDKLKQKIKTAFRVRDFQTLDKLALSAYGLLDLPDCDFVDTRK
jgi:hypothetical protein